MAFFAKMTHQFTTCSIKSFFSRLFLLLIEFVSTFLSDNNVYTPEALRKVVPQTSIFLCIERLDSTPHSLIFHQISITIT